MPSPAPRLHPAKCPDCRGAKDAPCRPCNSSGWALAEAVCERCGVGVSAPAVGPALCTICWHGEMDVETGE